MPFAFTRVWNVGRNLLELMPFAKKNDYIYCTQNIVEECAGKTLLFKGL